MSKKYKLRSQIIAKKDHLLISWDLAQAETWVVAYLANENTMKEQLLHGDIHVYTAMGIYNKSAEEIANDPTPGKPMRYMGKQTNHSSAYGIEPPHLCRTVNRNSDKPPYITVSIEQAKYFSEVWHSLYNIKDWWNEIQMQLAANRTLVTPYGRVFYFMEPWGKELFKTAYSSVPQSTVSDHTKGNIHDELGIEGGLIKVDELYVQKGVFDIIQEGHDSFIAEIHKSVAMELAYEIREIIHRPLVINGEIFYIPVDIQYGERWGELEEIKGERKAA